MAERGEGMAAKEDMLQLVIFKIGGEEFAFDVSRVVEVVKVPHVTKVPKSVRFILGIINWRGELIPVIDLRRRFGLEEVPYKETTRIVVVFVNEMTVGFLVDLVLETRQVAASCVEPPPGAIMGGDQSEFISGIANLEGIFISMLDIEKILALPQRT